MLCNNEKCKEIAIEMFKKAVKEIKSKMSPKLAESITFQLMNTLKPNGRGLTFGDTTISRDLKESRIRFNLDAVAAYVENEGCSSAWALVQKTVRHESFHAFQWLWVGSKGGHKAIEKLMEYNRVTPYKKNVMEIGAWDYEDPATAKMQNFNEAFAFLF